MLYTTIEQHVLGYALLMTWSYIPVGCRPAVNIAKVYISNLTVVVTTNEHCITGLCTHKGLIYNLQMFGINQPVLPRQYLNVKCNEKVEYQVQLHIRPSGRHKAEDNLEICAPANKTSCIPNVKHTFYQSHMSSANEIALVACRFPQGLG